MNEEMLEKARVMATMTVEEMSNTPAYNAMMLIRQRLIDSKLVDRDIAGEIAASIPVAIDCDWSAAIAIVDSFATVIVTILQTMAKDEFDSRAMVALVRQMELKI